VQFKLEIIAPPEELAGRINTFYVIETEAPRIEEFIPAYSAQLAVIPCGRLAITDGEGVLRPAPTAFAIAPLLTAAPCVLEGPTTIVGASLTHLGWQALANLPADAVHDRIIPAADFLAPALVDRLEDAVAACAAGAMVPRDLCGPLGAVVAAAPHALRPDHVAVIEAILRWLASGFDPAIGDLYASVSLSPRQLQRICRRYFGVPPAQVLKRFRALRAAMLLAQPGLSAAFHDEMMATYFDQAHLIHDIRRYTGRTPTQFRQESLARELLDPAAHGEAGALLNRAGEKTRNRRRIDG